VSNARKNNNIFFEGDLTALIWLLFYVIGSLRNYILYWITIWVLISAEIINHNGHKRIQDKKSCNPMSRFNYGSDINM